MRNFLNLIRNENSKIFSRVGTLAMLGILLLAVIVTGLFTKYNSTEQTDWKKAAITQKTEYEKILSEENLAKVAEDNFQQRLEIINYRLENDIPPIESNTLWGSMELTTNLISIITLFTVIVGASSVASEFSWGTIKLLLIRPVSRTKILLSKYVSVLLFALISMVLLFGSSFLLGSTLFGLGDVGQPYLAYVDGNVVEKNMISYILSLYGYSSVDLLMLVTFAFMLSTVFRSSSLAIGLAMFLMFMGPNIVSLLANFGYTWAKYILFANTNLTQYVNGTPMVEGMTLTFSIIILTIYFVVFNLLSWYIFKTRDVAA